MTTGVLLIHGFAGTPNDVEPLKKYLTDKGFIVKSPMLQGHGLSRKDLSKSKYIDWIDSATNAAYDLMKQCDKLIIIGFSMGGLIAVNLQNTIKAEKLILINTPVYYWDIKRIIYNLMSDVKLYSKKYFTSSTDKSIFAMIEFLKLLRLTKPLISKIKSPILIIQTMDDDTVHNKSADYIFSKINGKKELKKYKTGGHLLFQNNNHMDVCTEISKFIMQDFSKM